MKNYLLSESSLIVSKPNKFIILTSNSFISVWEIKRDKIISKVKNKISFYKSILLYFLGFLNLIFITLGSFISCYLIKYSDANLLIGIIWGLIGLRIWFFLKETIEVDSYWIRFTHKGKVY
jgi:hypothetical protein